MPRAPEEKRRAGSSLPTRLMWFVALWVAGLAAVSLAALLIRTVLRA